jgi:hypothetical protein
MSNPNTNKVNNDPRAPRAQEMRAADQIHEEYDVNWDDDSLLNTDNIPPRDGFVQRWVRTTINGIEDQKNVQKKYNRGWRPRLLDTVPKGQFVMNIDFNGQQVIGIHGMILMERPEALHNRQQASVRNSIDLQMQAVDADLQDVHDPKSGMTKPEFLERKQRAATGKRALIDD